MTKLAAIIATWFGCGLFPAAPGTVGSLAALILGWPLVHHHGFTPHHFAALTVILTPLGMWAANKYAHSLGAKDPGRVVVDEVLGQWLTLSGAHSLGSVRPWLIAFVLFRLFDIVKPFPVRKLESLPGGIGIVADDLGAGVYAAIVLMLAGWFNLY